MCIRDRVLSIDSPGGSPVQAGLINDEILRLKALHKKPVYACLLYTSDAADDLLCVDLGGRRIIKKKQPEKYEQTRTV